MFITSNNYPVLMRTFKFCSLSKFKLYNTVSSTIVSMFCIQFSCSVVSNYLQPHELQLARFPCLSLTPGACSNSHPLSQWCHPTISSSIASFSFFPQFYPTTGYFPVVMYGCENWTVKKAECQGIDAFELWFWRRLLRVPWIARRSNKSILK